MHEKEEAEEKRKLERRFTLVDVLDALNFHALHVELPGSKKFARLVAKHYLSILNYKALEYKLTKRKAAGILGLGEEEMPKKNSVSSLISNQIKEI